jgi:hypothetical protein
VDDGIDEIVGRLLAELGGRRGIGDALAACGAEVDGARRGGRASRGGRGKLST